MVSFLDITGLSTLVTNLRRTFVLKEIGKGLSSNDYTGTEKRKLSGIASGAEVNIVDAITVNGIEVTPDANKTVDIEVPTKVTDLENNAGYITNQEAIVMAIIF